MTCVDELARGLFLDLESRKRAKGERGEGVGGDLRRSLEVSTGVSYVQPLGYSLIFLTEVLQSTASPASHFRWPSSDGSMAAALSSIMGKANTSHTSK